MKKSCRRRGQSPLTGDELGRQGWVWTGQQSKTLGQSSGEVERRRGPTRQGRARLSYYSAGLNCGRMQTLNCP